MSIRDSGWSILEAQGSCRSNQKRAGRSDQKIDWPLPTPSPWLSFFACTFFSRGRKELGRGFTALLSCPSTVSFSSETSLRGIAKYFQRSLSRVDECGPDYRSIKQRNIVCLKKILTRRWRFVEGTPIILTAFRVCPYQLVMSTRFEGRELRVHLPDRLHLLDSLRLFGEKKETVPTASIYLRLAKRMSLKDTHSWMNSRSRKPEMRPAPRETQTKCWLKSWNHAVKGFYVYPKRHFKFKDPCMSDKSLECGQSLEERTVVQCGDFCIVQYSTKYGTGTVVAFEIWNLNVLLDEML